ncbi:MAG: hypothetical protein Q4C25_03375 [Bacillota bacterium]|nr:hypothetical protein [Bacillota bacterium]
MSLIVCTECGKEFSDRAKRCPQCACPTEYVLSTINANSDSYTKRIVRKPAPVRIKPYCEMDSNREEYNHFPENQFCSSEKTKGITSKFNKIVNYVKAEGVGNIVDSTLRSIDDAGKELKDVSEENRNKLFEKCTLQYQLIIDMRHAGWNKEIKVYDREGAMLYRGLADFHGKPKDAYLETSLGNDVFRVRQCNPNEYKWELLPSDRFNKMMEKAEIYFEQSQGTVLTSVPSIKKEVYRLSDYNWRIEMKPLGLSFDIYDANKKQVAKVYKKISGKSDIYVIDYQDNVLQKMFLAIVIAIDICKSQYEPGTLREKLDW